jgi:hypothetical protein
LRKNREQVVSPERVPEQSQWFELQELQITGTHRLQAPSEQGLPTLSGVDREKFLSFIIND